MASRRVILSGMRPTGPLHIGHLFGALDNWRRLQDEGADCHYMIADWHALSTEYADPGTIAVNVEEVALDFLAAGLDPARSTIFVQSDVPEHAELHLIFSMMVPIPWLERNPVYKEQVHELAEKDVQTYGFLGYPVLQAADILIYRATHVPIGMDQLPHLELTREISRRFNHLYGETLPIPDALLTETPKVPGTDNRKMSKSYGNAIFLKDDPDTIRQKVRNMFTDPKRVYRKDPGHPETCPVFDYARLFDPGSLTSRHADCREARKGCTECKAEISEKVVGFLSGIRQRRQDLELHRARLREILAEGGRKARRTARATLADVRKALEMEYGTDKH